MEKKDYLMYDQKPLIRMGDVVYYGNPSDKYYIYLELDGFVKKNKIDVATKVTIQLMGNQNGMDAKNKIVKKAERDGLYAALDIGCFWLKEALSWK